MSNVRLINAEKLFEKVGQIKPRNKEHYKAIGEFMNMITNSETVESTSKGEWITEKRDPQDVYAHIYCSECGAYWSSPTLVDSFNYCPKCGADMRGEDNDN